MDIHGFQMMNPESGYTRKGAVNMNQKCHTGRRSEKLAKYHLNVGTAAHIFLQSLLDGIYSVAFGCTHKK